MLAVHGCRQLPSFRTAKENFDSIRLATQNTRQLLASVEGETIWYVELGVPGYKLLQNGMACLGRSGNIGSCQLPTGDVNVDEAGVTLKEILQALHQAVMLGQIGHAIKWLSRSCGAEGRA